MRDAQHCPRCAAEYVAGVPACAECGGRLTAGPLPGRRHRDKSAGRPETVADSSSRSPDMPFEPPDVLLLTLSGLEAEFAAKALTLENIPCLLECESVRRLRLPGDAPAEPVAVTLPVNLYVPRAQVEEARGVLESMGGRDLIGEQWHGSQAGRAAGGTRPGAQRGAGVLMPGGQRAAGSYGRDATAAGGNPNAGAPQAEGIGFQWMLIVAGAAAVGLLLFL